jgi:hypothetical protein
MALAKASYDSVLHGGVTIDLIEGKLDILEIHLPQ